MTATGYWYGLSQRSALDALIALGTAKVMILSSTYTPNQDTDQYVSAIDTNEIASGGGYTTGGIDVSASIATAYDTANNRSSVTFTAITGLTVTGQWGVLYIDTGTTTTSPLLGYWDLSEGLGTDVSITGVTPDAAGAGYIDVA